MIQAHALLSLSLEDVPNTLVRLSFMYTNDPYHEYKGVSRVAVALELVPSHRHGNDHLQFAFPNETQPLYNAGEASTKTNAFLTDVLRDEQNRGLTYHVSTPRRHSSCSKAVVKVAGDEEASS
jgi:hypothetical protein